MSAEKQIAAAEGCARTTLQILETRAPNLIASLDPVSRELFLAGMGLAFNEGVLYGARSMADSILSVP